MPPESTGTLGGTWHQTWTSDWLAAEALLTGSNGLWVAEVRRCSLGDGAQHVRVEASRDQGATISWEHRILVPRSWHSHAAPMTVGLQESSFAGQLDGVSAALDTAIGAWNSAVPGLFRRVAAHETPDILVKKNPEDGTAESCVGRPLGCVLPDPLGDCPEAQPGQYKRCLLPTDTSYPHLRSQQLLLITTFFGDDYHRWTRLSFIHISPHHHHLPTVLIHELGHAGGVGHSVHFDDLMYAGDNLYARAENNTLMIDENSTHVPLSERDKGAMRSARPTHTHEEE